MSKSDFGRGYATCLRQFVNHAQRLTEAIELYRDMRSKHADLFSEAGAVEMWANGASDHLYELHRPKRGVANVEWQRAKATAARALDIGHGFRVSSKSNPSEALALLDAAASCLIALERAGYAVATLEQAMDTDVRLGLRPDSGTWSCSEDIARKPVPA